MRSVRTNIMAKSAPIWREAAGLEWEEMGVRIGTCAHAGRVLRPGDSVIGPAAREGPVLFTLAQSSHGITLSDINMPNNNARHKLIHATVKVDSSRAESAIISVVDRRSKIYKGLGSCLEARQVLIVRSGCSCYS